MQNSEPLKLKNPGVAAFLAWLVPGLGHLYQGRVGKGLLYAVCILGLFVAGMRQGGGKVVYFRWDEEEWRWPYLAQIGVGIFSLNALVPQTYGRDLMPQRLANFESLPSEEEIDKLHRTLGKRMDVALIYTMVAGLLNILVIFDALHGPALYADERRRLAEAAAFASAPPEKTT